MKKKKIEIKLLPINEVKPHPKNPKKHWEEGLKESLKEMGYVEPIVVDENNVMLAGHGRLKQLKELGNKEVEVVVKRGLTEKQKERYLILSNKIGERGGWDWEKLAQFNDEFLSGVGFDEMEIAKHGIAEDWAEEIDFGYKFGTINSWIRIGNFTAEISDEKYEKLKSLIEDENSLEDFLDKIIIYGESNK